MELIMYTVFEYIKIEQAIVLRAQPGIAKTIFTKCTYSYKFIFTIIVLRLKFLKIHFIRLSEKYTAIFPAIPQIMLLIFKDSTPTSDVPVHQKELSLSLVS